MQYVLTNKTSGSEHVASAVVKDLQKHEVMGMSIVVVSAKDRHLGLSFALSLAEVAPFAMRPLLVGDKDTYIHPKVRIKEDAILDSEAVSDVQEVYESHLPLSDEDLGVLPSPYGYFYEVTEDGTLDEDTVEIRGQGYDFLIQASRRDVVVLDGFVPAVFPDGYLHYLTSLDPATYTGNETGIHLGDFTTVDHNMSLLVMVLPEYLVLDSGTGLSRITGQDGRSSYVTDVVTVTEDYIQHDRIPLAKSPFPGYSKKDIPFDDMMFEAATYTPPGVYHRNPERVAGGMLKDVPCTNETDQVLVVFSPDRNKALDFAISAFGHDAPPSGVTVIGDDYTLSRVKTSDLRYDFVPGEPLYDEDGFADTPGLLSDDDYIVDLFAPYTYLSVPVEFGSHVGNRRIIILARDHEEVTGKLLRDPVQLGDGRTGSLFWGYVKRAVEITGNGLLYIR